MPNNLAFVTPPVTVIPLPSPLNVVAVHTPDKLIFEDIVFPPGTVNPCEKVTTPVLFVFVILLTLRVDIKPPYTITQVFATPTVTVAPTATVIGPNAP